MFTDCLLPGLLGTRAVNLRDYQRRAVDEVHRRLDSGAGRVILFAPCGAGKTEMGLAWIDEEIQHGRRVFVLTDRLPLLDQTVARAERAGLPVDVLHRGRTAGPGSRIVVTTVQTLARRTGELAWLPDSVLLDEAHVGHEFAHRFCSGVAERGGRALGLSATPIGPGLYSEWSEVVGSVTHAELVKRGFLLRADVEDRSKGVAWTESSMDGCGRHAGEWSKGETAGRMQRFTRPIAEDVASWLAENGGGPVPRMILFGATQAHAKELVAAVSGVLGVAGRCIIAETDEAERRETVAAFDAGDVPILGSVAALTLGFDSPRAEVLISARPLSRSVAWWLQMVGRVERAAGGKKRAVVLDYVSNGSRFRRPVARLRKSGVTELPVPIVRGAVRRVWVCRTCSSGNTPRRDFCSRCGTARTWPCRGCSSEVPVDEAKCGSCGTLRKGWRECPGDGCGHAQHVSTGCCQKCGLLFRGSDQVPMCRLCGMPLEAPVPPREESPRLLVCTMPGCRYEWDPDGADRDRVRDSVDTLPEPRRTVAICAARITGRVSVSALQVQRWGADALQYLGRGPEPEGGYLAVLASLTEKAGIAACVSGLSAEVGVRERLVEFWLEKGMS